MERETLFVIIGTLLFFAFFLGVIVYAFDRRRRNEFEHQAHLPLEDEYSSELHDGLLRQDGLKREGGR